MKFHSKLDQIGSNSMMDWIGLDWIGLDWIGLDWIGLDWIGLDWIGLEIELKIEIHPMFLSTPEASC